MTTRSRPSPVAPVPRQGEVSGAVAGSHTGSITVTQPVVVSSVGAVDPFRREALAQAVAFARGRGHSEADVVDNAAVFETYLRNGVR